MRIGLPMPGMQESLQLQTLQTRLVGVLWTASIFWNLLSYDNQCARVDLVSCARSGEKRNSKERGEGVAHGEQGLQFGQWDMPATPPLLGKCLPCFRLAA